MVAKRPILCVFLVQRTTNPSQPFITVVAREHPPKGIANLVGVQDIDTGNRS